MTSDMQVGAEIDLIGAKVKVTRLDVGTKLTFIGLKLLSGKWPTMTAILEGLGCRAGGWVALHNGEAEVYCIPK